MRSFFPKQPAGAHLRYEASAAQSGARAVIVGAGVAVAVGDAVGVGLADDGGAAHAASAPALDRPSNRRKRRRSINV